jgi:hypothetical protein
VTDRPVTMCYIDGIVTLDVTTLLLLPHQALKLTFLETFSPVLNRDMDTHHVEVAPQNTRWSHLRGALGCYPGSSIAFIDGAQLVSKSFAITSATMNPSRRREQMFVDFLALVDLALLGV